MMGRAKTYVVLDNARVHRRNILRVLFQLHVLRVYFLPPYSPWYAHPEKIFLITHMKCNKDVEWTPSEFIRNVCEILHRHTERECRGVLRVTGWL